MEKIQGRTFQADRAWSGPSIMTLPDATVKLRWTDAPFRWHTNEGQEVFVVLDGTVDMHVRRPGAVEQVITLEPGDLLHIREGEEHMAHPRGQARILVIERAAST